MAQVHCFSNLTFGALPRARILVETLRRAHPDWVLWAVMVDEAPGGKEFGVNRCFNNVVYARTLPFERYQNWMFRHEMVEACAAVKGEMLCHLLKLGAEKVVYLAPDIALFGSLNSIVEALDRYSIILTPHQVEANEPEWLVQDNELASLKHGIFNLGFIAVRNDTIGNDFARWWARQLYFACCDDAERGIFMDQKWCDLVPALFPGVFVERDPACNVASWNLSRRRMSITTGGDILINKRPLKFFNFAQVDSRAERILEKNARDNTEVYEVWNWYKRELGAKTIAGIPEGYWFYGTFDNGDRIPRKVREFFSARPDLVKCFEDPFRTAGSSFYQWLGQNEPALLREY